MQEHLATVRLSRTALLLAASAAVLIVIVAVWFGIRWQLGDMFSEVSSPADPQAMEIADAAIRYAPSNPRGYWLAGSVLKAEFDEASVLRAIGHYELAARVSPNRFTSWTELGRVNELAGRYEHTEQAFLRALEVAPEYTLPRWQLGNFYLRRGRTEEAVRELRYAALHNSPYKVQVFSLAWNVLGNEPKQVERFLSENDESKATLAYFYGTVNRPDDALRLWNSIDPANRSRFEWQLKAIARDLYAHRSLRGALQFSRQTGADPDARPDVITNGDFESPIRGSDMIRFDWKISRIDPKVDVSAETSTQHRGKRSLRFAFRGYSGPDLHVLDQSVAVQPGGRYRLSFWVRTEALTSGSAPVIEIRNAADDSLNAVSPPFPLGTAPWQEVQVDLTIPKTTDGIYLATAREPCPAECPITGTFWLDSFELTRLE